MTAGFLDQGPQGVRSGSSRPAQGQAQRVCRGTFAAGLGSVFGPAGTTLPGVSVYPCLCAHTILLMHEPF